MERFGIKLNETTKHYIGLFIAYGSMLAVMFVSVQLAEHTEWFAEFWASKTNRAFTIFGLPPLLLYLGYQFHSYFWGKKKLIRSFKGVERLKLQDCKDGEKVRIQGKLLSLSNPVLAPLSQRECVAFTLRASREVERASPTGTGQVRSETAWETLKFEQHAEDFLIECGGDYVLVRTLGSEIIIRPDSIHDISSYSLDKGGFLTPEENDLRKGILEAMEINSRPYVGVYAANLKFEEGVLEENEQVAIVGTGHWRNISDVKEFNLLAEKEVTRVFEICTTEGVQTYISDSQDLLDKATY